MSAATARRLTPRSSAPDAFPDARSARVLARSATALRLVPQARSSAPRAPFVTMVVLLLAGGLLGLLVLNTVLAQDAFRLHALVKEQKALVDREQTLEREVETLRTPRNLAERARELGMVQGSTPAFLRLSDGAVLGAEVPAGEDLPEGEVATGAGAGASADSTDEESTDDAETADDTDTTEDP